MRALTSMQAWEYEQLIKIAEMSIIFMVSLYLIKTSPIASILMILMLSNESLLPSLK